MKNTDAHVGQWNLHKFRAIFQEKLMHDAQ